MTLLNIPKEVQHQFLFAFDLSEQCLDGGQAFRCKFCRQWTNNPDLIGVCHARERRRTQRRRGRLALREVWMGRRNEDFDYGKLTLRQSKALGDICQSQDVLS